MGAEGITGLADARHVEDPLVGGDVHDLALRIFSPGAVDHDRRPGAVVTAYLAGRAAVGAVPARRQELEFEGACSGADRHGRGLPDAHLLEAVQSVGAVVRRFPALAEPLDRASVDTARRSIGTAREASYVPNVGRIETVARMCPAQVRPPQASRHQKDDRGVQGPLHGSPPIGDPRRALTSVRT